MTIWTALLSGVIMGQKAAMWQDILFKTIKNWKRSKTNLILETRVRGFTYAITISLQDLN